MARWLPISNPKPEWILRMRIPRLRARRALLGLILISAILLATTASHGCTVSGSSPDHDGSGAITGPQAQTLA